MSKTTIAIGAIACCFVFATECTADLLIDIAVESVQGIEPKIKQSQLQLRLGNDYLKIVESDLELIYDFDARRMLWINQTENYYSDTSLYAAVGGREHELKNRQHLRESLKETGSSAIPLVLSEHELSMGGPVKISKKQDTDNIDYIYDGKVLLSRSRKSTQVAEPYLALFLRFFVHRYGGHPSIVNTAFFASGIPDRISITHSSGVTKTLTMESVAEHEPVDYSLHGLSQRYDVNPMLHKLAGKLTGDSRSARVANENALLVTARHALSERRFLESMLGYFEYSLVSGAQSLPWSESERAAIAADPQVTQLFAAIQNPKDQDDARAALAALDALEGEPTEQYMLNLFAANIHAKLGEIGKAKMLIGTALEENPYIVSAWIDLGEFYFLDFDPTGAWFCWDIARRLHPDHHLLVKTSTLEQRLAKKYPYFF